MTRPVLIVTCSEPDATPFLAALPEQDLSRTLLISTKNVISAAQRLTPIPETFVLGGPDTWDETRRLLAGDVHITVVVAPDPWGPLQGKGFVRARQVLPLVLPDVPVDVIDLDRGGVTGRERRSVTRAALARWLHRWEAYMLADYLVRTAIGGHASPGALAWAIVCLAASPLVAVVTLARCVAYIARTECRVRKTGESVSADRS
jgi:hypothetical protein